MSCVYRRRKRGKIKKKGWAMMRCMKAWEKWKKEKKRMEWNGRVEMRKVLTVSSSHMWACCVFPQQKLW